MRQRAREISRLLGFDRQDQTRVATAVSEIARSAFECLQGGQVEFYIINSRPPALHIQISDRGKGISKLKGIFEDQKTSSTGLTLGTVGARKLVDEFRIDSSPESGTKILLTKWLPPQFSEITSAQISSISKDLLKSTQMAPLGELQEQNQELIQTLNILQEKQVQLLQLNQKLEVTNKGIVALYEELDEKAQALKKANEIKTRFLSNITHEFRTPLGSTINLVEMLLAELEGPLLLDQKKFLEIIQKTTFSLLELVNDLLDVAKVEAGKVPVRPSTFLLSTLFSSLRALLEPLAEENIKIKLEFIVPENFPELYTDEGKLTQILRNLVSNAIKYTETGFIRVEGRKELENFFTVSVADSGIGIRTTDLEKIFEEFTQIESPLQAKYKGTGLGLALSQRLTHLLGGELHVESVLGKGSIFSITLPFRYTGPVEGHYISSEISPNTSKVLIIDDQKEERYFLKSALLSRFNCEIIETSNGAQGSDIAKNIHPDLVFLDLSMPEMNGFEVLKKFASTPELIHIPVVIFTGTNINSEERHQLKHARGILSKVNESEEYLLDKIFKIAASVGLTIKVPSDY